MGLVSLLDQDLKRKHLDYAQLLGIVSILHTDGPTERDFRIIIIVYKVIVFYLKITPNDSHNEL